MEYLWVGRIWRDEDRGRVSIGSCHLTAVCDLCQNQWKQHGKENGIDQRVNEFWWNSLEFNDLVLLQVWGELLSSLANEVKLSCKSFKAIVLAQLAPSWADRPTVIWGAWKSCAVGILTLFFISVTVQAFHTPPRSGAGFSAFSVPSRGSWSSRPALERSGFFL